MPLQFLPRKSGAHRIACIALYRALLSHTSHIPLPTNLPSQGKVNPIKHVIRKEFRRYVNHHSPAIVVEALKQGYVAEDLLRKAADSEPESLETVNAQLWQLHDSRVLARATCLPPPVPSLRASLKRRVWPYPSALPLLSVRPLPKEALSGKRIVPRLAQTNGVPFLRTSKTQSAFLSRYLKDKYSQKQIRFDHLQMIREGIDAAEAENEWEGLVVETIEDELDGEEVEVEKRKLMGRWLDGESGRQWIEGRWERHGKTAEWELSQKLRDQTARWVDMGRIMGEIVEEEKALAAVEKQQNDLEKRRARLERKAKKKD